MMSLAQTALVWVGAMFMSVSVAHADTRVSSNLDGHAPYDVHEGTVRDASTLCERAVEDRCRAVSCIAYCHAINTPKALWEGANTKQSPRDQQNEALCIKKCKNSGVNAMCEVKAPNNYGSSQGDHSILEALNFDRFIGCVAKKRDPDNVRTGRREGDPLLFQTQRYANLLQDRLGSVDEDAIARNVPNVPNVSSFDTFGD